MDIFIFKPGFILEVLPALLEFLPVTLLVTGLSAVLGLLFGALLARAKLSQRRLPRLVAAGYTTIMRCTPSVVLLFVVYYGLPLVVQAISGKSIQYYTSVFFAVLALTMLFSATSSELLRSAYVAVDKGQREAAVSIGLSGWQAFYRIELPQCIRMILPNLAVSLVGLMKETSLAFTIGVIDIMGKAKLVIANNYNAYGSETYLAVALIYWVLTFLVRRGARLIEKQYDRRRPDFIV